MPDIAYVGDPFVFDLFISYSHGADASGEAYLQEWSAAFAKELGRELRSDVEFRDSVQIFLDADHRPGLGVDPMAPLTEQLRERIGQSAMLVVLMSPDYLKSRWCADEREWWFERQTALGLLPKERTAIVKIWPTKEAWPAALTDSRGHPLIGFDFYDTSEGPPRPLGWVDLPGPFGKEFRKALLAVVGRISRRLEETRTQLMGVVRVTANASKLLEASGQSLYVHGRVDRTRSWERAALALSKSGFAVVPGEPDQMERDVVRLQEMRERRVETLRECDALLLVGTDDTRAVDADLVVVGKRDRQSARARWKHLLPCALLNTVGASLATAVRAETTRNAQVDWIDGTTDPWIPSVQQWLRRKGEAEVGAEALP